MKTRIIILFIAICIKSTAALSQIADNMFSMKGHITGLQQGKIYISYSYNGSTIVDSSLIRNGNFEFSGRINQPVPANLRLINTDILDKQAVFIFLEPASLSVELSNSPFSALSVQGSKSHQEFLE